MAPGPSRWFARHDRPLILGETFSADPATLESFLRGSVQWLDGTLSSFDGRLAHEVQGTSLEDVFYSANLTAFLGMRDALTGRPPAGPAPAL